MFISYQPSIPTGSIPLNQDYVNIQANFTQINTQFNVDHVPLTSTSGTPPNGYHTAIHLVPQAPPPPVAGYAEIYAQTSSDGIGTGQQLFYQYINSTPSTINFPFTRNFAPVSSTNGSTFLPGGLILQWGTAALPGTGTTNFNIKTANIFNIQVTLIGNSSSSNIVSIVSSTPGSPGSFKWNFTGSTSYTSFFWMAVTN